MSSWSLFGHTFLLLLLLTTLAAMTDGAFLVPTQVARSSTSSASASRKAELKGPPTSVDAGLKKGNVAASSSASSSLKNKQPRTHAKVSTAAAASALAPSQAMPGGWGGVAAAPGGRRRRQRQRKQRKQQRGRAASRTELGSGADDNNNEAGGSRGVAAAAAAAAAAADRSMEGVGTADPKVGSSDSTRKSGGGGGNIKKNKNNKAKRPRMTGNIPDVHWRAIPMSHLRHHPHFESLPHPDSISQLHSLEDVRLFRQESWQWDALHSGRCTTSQATAALGFLEPRTGKVLGIPRSLQKGAVGAFHRLRRPALRTLEEMNTVLCTGEGNGPQERDITDAPTWDNSRDERNNGAAASDGDGRSRADGKVIVRPANFAAVYLPRTKRADLDRRRELVRNYYTDDTSRWGARMQWGNAQEATAILTALNYFAKVSPGSKVREVGMCGAGLQLNVTESSTGVIIGATPDGVVHYPNGTLEALEVKNHCPFVPANWGGRRRATKQQQQDKKRSDSSDDTFRIRESPIQVDVPPAYVPQLMLEMLSLGQHCRSAVMVRQTATKGAVILRLQRDDEWIDEMIHWLNRFTEQFVSADVPPPANFFWNNHEEFGGGERYRAFVSRTKEISESAELVRHVPHGEIQRVVSTRQFQIPLFLD